MIFVGAYLVEFCNVVGLQQICVHIIDILLLVVVVSNRIRICDLTTTLLLFSTTFTTTDNNSMSADELEAAIRATDLLELSIKDA